MSSSRSSADSRLTIPEEAIEQACDLTYRGQQLTPNHARHLLEYAAPLIVAAELERLADGLPGGWKTWSADYQAGRYDARQYFLNRAAELRGSAPHDEPDDMCRLDECPAAPRCSSGATVWHKRTPECGGAS